MSQADVGLILMALSLLGVVLIVLRIGQFDVDRFVPTPRTRRIIDRVFIAGFFTMLAALALGMIAVAALIE